MEGHSGQKFPHYILPCILPYLNAIESYLVFDRTFMVRYNGIFALNAPPYLSIYFQVFPGNVDRDTVVTNALSPEIRHTRYVRFVVMTRNKMINMRVEVYGCKE